MRNRALFDLIMSLGEEELSRKCPSFEANMPKEDDYREYIPMGYAENYHVWGRGSVGYLTKGKPVRGKKAAYVMARRFGLYVDKICPWEPGQIIRYEFQKVLNEKEIRAEQVKRSCNLIREKVSFMANWEDQAIRNFFNNHFEVVK
jgi:hypothetical protein